MAAVGLAFGIFVKEDLKRLNYESAERLATQQTVLSCQETAGTTDLASKEAKVFSSGSDGTSREVF